MFLYKLIMYFCLFLGIMFLIISIVTFIKFDIVNIIAELAGVSSNKKIQKIHSTSKSRNSHFNPEINVRKNVRNISISSKLDNMNTYSSDLYDSQNLNYKTGMDNSDNIQATIILNDNFETEILKECKTSELEEVTNVLETHDAFTENIYFKIITSKLVINTNEIIE